MFSNIKVLLIVAAIFISYFFYSQYRISSLVEDNASISEKLETVEQTLARTRDAVKIQKDFLRYSETQRQEAASQVRRLERTLAESDLERLSIAKPGLIERRINNATNEFFKEVERETNTD